MQLEMDRSQKKGIFKTQYVLRAHLLLSPEERDLLRKHKLDDIVLFDAEEEWGSPHIFRVTAGGYITKGTEFKCATVNELSILENRLEENCRQLAAQLKNLKGAFDGGPRKVSFDEE
jgi:hypothetical protein